MQRLLVIRHGANFIGMDLAVVQEVLRMLEMRPLPGAPSRILGVIDLRGRLIPVLDLESRLPVGAERCMYCGNGLMR